MHDPLTDYIMAQRAKGVGDEQIRQKLMDSGYRQEQIEGSVLGGHGTEKVVSAAPIAVSSPDTGKASAVALENISIWITVGILTLSVLASAWVLSYSMSAMAVPLIELADKMGVSLGSALAFDIDTDNGVHWYNFFMFFMLLVAIFITLDMAYIFLIRTIFLRKISLATTFRHFAAYLIIVAIFLLASLLYNMALLSIAGTVSIIALFFYPVLGLLIKNIMMAEAFRMHGYSRLRSYLVLALPLIVIISMGVFLAYMLTWHPYFWILRVSGI